MKRTGLLKYAGASWLQNMFGVRSRRAHEAAPQ
jgi:hypothetical protein